MLTGWRLALSKLFIIPQRYVLSIMGLLAIANAYTMRVCLNLAITQMVKKKGTGMGDEHYDPYACVDYNAVNSSVSNTTGESSVIDDEPILFEWSEVTQGLILGSFYYGYVLTHIPGGMLSEKFGGKWVLGLGLLSTAVCTFITPITVKLGGATALFILRVIEGLGEGSKADLGKCPVTMDSIMIIPLLESQARSNRIRNRGSLISSQVRYGTLRAVIDVTTNNKHLIF